MVFETAHLSMRERGRIILDKTCTAELHRGRLFHPQGDIMGSADCGFCVLLDEAQDSTLLVNIEEIVVDIVC